MTVSAPATSALAMSPEYWRPPSAMTGMPARARRERRLVDGGHLRDADAGDDARGADGSGSDAHLDGVRSGVDERLRARAGRDVAADHVDVRRGRVALQAADDVEHALAVAVGGVDHEHVHACLDERERALPGVAEEADGRADAEAPLGILRGVRVLLGLVEVLDGDEAAQLAGVVHQRELLDLVLREDRDGVVRVDADPAGDERGAGHDVADERRGRLHRRDEAHVAVRDDADERAVRLDDREAGDAELPAERVHLGDRGVGARGDRVRDHAGLAALHLVDEGGLVLDGEVAVDDPEPALAGHGDRHARLGDGVHRGGEEGSGDADVARQAGGRVRLARDDVGVPRQEHDVVVGEADDAERVGLIQVPSRGR
ncbi:hypothetical protein QFZ62_002525 [Clavibacter sp. B3I6]|nr:hypothetical protein [Clavibacter sp. B3I6]